MGVTDNRRNVYFNRGDDVHGHSSSDDDFADWEIIPRESSESPPPPPRRRPPASPSARRKEPIYGHKLTLKKGRRSRHRYENERMLFSVGFGSAGEPEGAPDGLDIVQETRSYFTVLLDEDNTRLLEVFIGEGDHVGECNLHGVGGEREGRFKRANNDDDDPESAFLSIGSSMRAALKKHLPLGMLEGLESGIKNFFVDNPHSAYVAGNLSSYERLLAHAASSYHHLQSRSFDENGTRVLKIDNPAETFNPVDPSLSKYLVIRSRKEE